MVRLSITRALLVIVLTLGWGVPAAAEHGTTSYFVTAGSDTFMLVAQDTRFEPRLQLYQNLSVGWGFRTATLSFSGGIGLERARATRAAIGYSYPGWTGRTAWLTAGIEPKTWEAGIDVSIRAMLVGFDSTFLISFFPMLTATPYIKVPLRRGTSAKIGMSVGWQFRQDLGVAVGPSGSLRGAPVVGLSVSAVLSLPEAP